MSSLEFVLYAECLPSLYLLPQGLRIFQREVEAIKTTPGLVPNFICYQLQRNHIAFTRQRGSNALAILISTAWSHGTDGAAVTGMTANTIRRIQAAQNLGIENKYLYVSYASAEQANEV
ncbi:uncharacterized protein ATNIH1004_011361 [Aspergillus tanneri]|nr:uncharacterized protein ATNIH1004_011361 [Aspergillus tanneri]KAA8642417.1 hypothetical protein ATNIH1004_011361 [Aspergillus tanneri]